MSDQELKELREWSAGVMGWKTATVKVMDSRDVDNAWAEQVGPENIIYHWKKHWLPDNPSTGQIWLLVEKMRELGWCLALEDFGGSPDRWRAKFARGYETSLEKPNHIAAFNDNPCHAILLAARATEIK